MIFVFLDVSYASLKTYRMQVKGKYHEKFLSRINRNI